MINDEMINQYIEQIKSKFPIKEQHREFMRLLCHYLASVNTRLPAVGQESLEIAQSYWLQEGGTPERMDAARTQCWQYLDNKGSSIAIGDEVDTAMRAVLCVLYPVPADETFSVETVRWFFQLLNRLGDDQSI
ncbi:hypothetical protein [Thiothrix unzii]|uniref:Uncharacterized protein n=1 Tax=Thiothrix unzii TaxID=111769 RepID=A0A975F8I5_9GAMM|nr:hypothetical protein [Thiothrix unzii]QTR52395.1 hypothetical protein J9260_11715 [Thiothrix unzii]